MNESMPEGLHGSEPRSQPASPDSREALPAVISSRRIYEGKVLSLRVDEIALTGDRAAVREVVEHGGAVVVAAVDSDGYVYLVRQYRHAIGEWLLELPAGCLEAGERPLLAAQRELREEVGLEAHDWRPLGSFFSSPGFSSEELHAFLAQDLRTVPQDPDEDEDLIVVRYPLGELLKGEVEIRDGKTLATLLLVERECRKAPRLGR